ncbi:MAG: 50S ribosomal protein L13 [Crenarchaeota archaeon]|nr:50S ribosomal protein L13 [Thermoproteota archaeon]MDW8033940.1 50S ribosomal protein L13 [Nitrososphaerota archaeon]
MSDKVLIVDATNQILGRMCSMIAKRLLEGYMVHVINAEKARISGSKHSFIREYVKFLEIKSVRNPKHTPLHPRNPATYVRRVVRGMLPMGKKKGKDAFRRLRVHIGDPGNLKGQPVRFEEADAARLGGRSFTLSELKDIFKVPEAS